MMTIIRNVSFAQWKGCMFLQIGSVACVLGRLPGDRSWGLEIATERRWFALRPFKSLTWRRV